MQFIIQHESSGRLRLHTGKTRLTIAEADTLEFYFKPMPFIRDIKVYERTGDVALCFAKGQRAKVVEALSAFSFYDADIRALVPEHTDRKLSRKYSEKFTFKILGKGFRWLFFPDTLNMIWTVISSVRYLCKALHSLISLHLDVSFLDAAAITAAMLMGDFDTAGNVMFLLDTGDLLEEWTHKKSVSDLASAMSLKVDKVWIRTGSGEDVLVPVKQLKVGDHFIMRTSNVIPLDGKVLEGEASVNQSSMTGESEPVVKTAGSPVFAGTVVEEGECIIEVTKKAGSGKYDEIVRMIEESEKLKSETETKAFHLADGLVPWAFAGMLVTWLITRNVNRAMSFLMVDFSCALKLAMPLSVLSAIREAGEYDISVKGGKYMEAIAKADTIVFDKTGTLTYASPKVAEIYTFDDSDEVEDLKLAACLEEHYPHSIANAVVNEAKKRGINHDEMHSTVHYIVAHGIASSVGDKRCVIGSYHFVFEDEGIVIAEADKQKFDSIPEEYSPLYLAVDGRLKAVICIFDPLREDAADIVRQLHKMRISKICMMTGDNKKTAEAVARKLDLDEYHAEVLPEDKRNFVAEDQAMGRTVIMVGDGINDTPALSEADAGIAISDGAAIAREVADITLSGNNLEQLVITRKLSEALMSRIHKNYCLIMGINGTLIALGVMGILTPAVSSLLHNTSTMAIGIGSMRNLLPDQ